MPHPSSHSHPKFCWGRRQERSAPEITLEVLFKSLEDKFPDKCYCSLFTPRFWPSRWGLALLAGDPLGADHTELAGRSPADPCSMMH